ECHDIVASETTCMIFFLFHCLSFYFVVVMDEITYIYYFINLIFGFCFQIFRNHPVFILFTCYSLREKQ
ncbi:hypothetical protein L9F63_001439, partial [Diploptera punctata]